MSRGTMLPYLGYFSSRKYQRSASGMSLGLRVSPLVRGTQTRPPSPRADSEIRRHLSSPGMAVGCTCIISGLAYLAPACMQREAAAPVQTTDIVLLPKTRPL